MKKEDKVKAVVAILDLPERVERLEKGMKSILKAVEDNITVEANKATIAIPRQGDRIGFASPLTLLEKGITLYKESGAKGFVEKNKESLLKHFEGINEPYDIQEKAVLLMLQELRKDRDVKNYVFNNAESTIKDVADVAGIALRDIVFEEKGIEIEQNKEA